MSENVSLWLAIIAGIGGTAGIVQLLRLFFFRKVEGRKQSADAELAEVQARVQETTTQFDRANSLLDRLERRATSLEAKVEEQAHEIATLKEKLAEVSVKAKLTEMLQLTVDAIRSQLENKECLLTAANSTIAELRARLIKFEGNGK